ncbi:MAG TPA: hypothetical protein VFY15_00865 [Acidimicrobiia bacterium]|nr:hypothetical protein [Acidimicrobiia bacterium]
MRRAVVPLALGLLVLAGCGADDQVGVIVTGYAHAGPMCPVESIPPDPACADRAVEGAVVLVINSVGVTVAEPVTGEDGRFSVELAPGEYRFVPQPVEGLMGVAAEQRVFVTAQGVFILDFAYDTGIR